MTVIDRGGKRERVVCLECRAIHTPKVCPRRRKKATAAGGILKALSAEYERRRRA